MILQGKPPGADEAMRRAAGRVVARRASTVPSDLLPGPLQRRGGSAVPVASTVAQRLAVLRRVGSNATRPLRDSALVRDSRLARRADAGGQPRPIVIAGAAALEMHRDDLAKLPAAALGIVGVFANRVVKPPKVLESKTVPARVQRRSTHSWGLEITGALASWGAFGARGRGVKVAVLDTGVNAEHPDLRGKVKAFARFGTRGEIVEQGVARARDPDGHGTHVCGTIVGGNASGRWIGMAPQANLLVARVLDRNGGTDEQILKGIEWAVACGVDMINLSLGGVIWSPDMIDTYTMALIAARGAGALVVAAIGNEGAQTSGSPGSDLFALSVGATDVDDRVAAFSGGRTHVITKSQAFDDDDLPLVYSKPDLSAPGVDIWSSFRGRWSYLNGSSMAAPHVAGAAAQLLGQLDGRVNELRGLVGTDRVDALEGLLQGSVADLGENGQDHRYGYGRLSTLTAFARAVDLGYVGKA